MNKLYLLLGFSALFQACGIFGAMKSADESKSFWKDKTALYSDCNLKMHKKVYISKVAVKEGSRLSLSTFPSGGKEILASREATDKESGAEFYSLSEKPKGWKSNWIMYNPKTKQLVTFRSEGKSPEEFLIKRSDVQFTMGSKKISKGMSKGKAVREVSATRLRIEAQKKEEKRIQDSIREANTLKGKELASLEVVFIPSSSSGVGGSMPFGVVAKLKNGRQLKTSNLSGGLTPLDELEYSSDFGSCGQGTVSLPSSIQEFTQNEVTVTAKSKFHAEKASAKCKIWFASEMTVNANGNKGRDGDNGKDGRKDRPDGTDGGDGAPGQDGGQVEIRTKYVSTPAGKDLVEVQAYVNGVLTQTKYLEEKGQIIVNAKGGQGGEGGDGGDGWDAKMSCDGAGYLAGGRAGNGGNGGRGGNGGSLTASRSSLSISANLEAGAGGRKGGKGDGGKNVECFFTGNNLSSTYSSRQKGKQPDGQEGRAGTAGTAGKQNIR